MTIKQVLHRLNRRDSRFLPKISTPLKIFLVILFVFSTVLLSQKIFAQETNPIKEKQDAMMKGNNQEAWLDNAMGSNLMSLQIMLAGTFPDSILEYKKGDPVYKSYRPQGMVGFGSQVIASTFTPSASGILYLAQLKDSFLGKPVYAQNNTGFEGLSGILELWKMSRNIVYFLISLFFIILGIMIMLRIKISPQSVITIQSSLPKVITTLILVTFSYAIAGLCIDLINFLQPFAISLLFSTLKKDQAGNLFEPSWGDWSLTGMMALVQNLIGFLGLGDRPFSYNSLVTTNMDYLMAMTSRLVPNVVLMLLGTLIGGIIGSMAPVVGTVFGAAVGAIAIVAIVSLIIFIYIFKTVFNLVKCYITVLLNIIFAPFIIFIGIFPGSKNGFSKWITNLLANLLVFPICVLFLILANILVDNVGNKLWAPQIITGETWLLPLMVGIAAIAILSRLPTLIPEAVFNIKPSPFGKAIGEGLNSIPGRKIITKTVPATAKAGVDYADERYGEGNSVWKKALRGTNRILGGKYARKRIEDGSTTQSDKKR
jgi:hypothetical protein